MADAKHQPAGPPASGSNPGADAAVRAAVQKIKAANAADKYVRRVRRGK